MTTTRPLSPLVIASGLSLLAIAGAAIKWCAAM